MRWTLLAFTLPLSAHMVSISTGEAKLDGARLHYEMRMPVYEIAHLKAPERDLLPQVEFPGARRTGGSCRPVPAESAYLCEAEFEFPAPPATLQARSTLHRVTVPNHVHLLRAVRGDKSDQAVLDLSFPEATLRFEPPSLAERVTRQVVAGAGRVFTSPAQLLFLLALAVFARTGRERLLLMAWFLAGQIVASVAASAAGWLLAPRFLEAAAALTIAYLGVEALFLPEAGQRWLVVAVLGVFHGLAFAGYLTATPDAGGFALAGLAAGELAVFLLVAAGWRRLERPALARALSGVLLVIGLGWFFYRLSS